MKLLLALAIAASPTWQAYKDGRADAEPPKVIRYLDAHDGAPMVMLSGGRKSGMVPGTQLKVYRQATSAEGALWVELAQLKTVDVQDDVAVALVEAEGSALSRSLFPKHPGVMVGDFAVERRVTVARSQALAPTVTLTYHDLFADPKAMPGSFELKNDGYATLRDAAARFASMRLSMLMVEGYTDHNGRADLNQVESYQRALTVRQFLIDELGFDEKRVVAVGFGESEPADPSLAPGHVERNRRIVLKAIAAP